MVNAIRAGIYRSASGKAIDWSREVAEAVAAKRSIDPDSDVQYSGEARHETMRIQVANETTLGAAARLHAEKLNPLALNFANGIRPGGGFLSGARAQEENLCRSSALFATLEGDPMYEAHSRRTRADSTSWCILSPDVPVVRDDAGNLGEVPWPLSFITCAAPVATHLRPGEAEALMVERIDRVLRIASSYHYDSLVLGAWGCGAFGNDPAATASAFVTALADRFRGHFSQVVFAITDWSPERRFLGPFRDAVSGLSNKAST